MKKKIMAVTLCLAMVSTFAVGCGQKNETDSGKSEEKSSGKVEIEFVQVKREAAESYTKVIEAFEKENPDIVIKQNVVPDAQEVLMTRASSDSLPDMMNHWPTDAQFVQFEDEGLLLDLSEKDYMKNIDSKYLDAVKAKDGKNYIAPYNVNFMGVYYNKDKFEEAGYTMPTKWDELIALAEEIKAKGETPFILPNKDSWTVSNLWSNIEARDLGSHEDEFEKMKAGEESFETIPEYKSGVEKMIQLLDYANEDSLALGYAQAINDFANGEGWMFLQGSWTLPSFLSANPDFNVEFTIVNKYGNIYCTDTSIPEEYVKTIRNMTKEWMLFEGKEDEYYYGGLQGDNANILTFLYPLHTYGNTPIALLAVDINYKTFQSILENAFYENSGECFILTGEQELFHIGEDLYQKEEKGYIFDKSQKMMKENLIVDTFQSKGKNFYISSRQNMLSGWKIIQVIPEERLFEEVDQKIKWNSIFLLGALMLVVSFSIYYIKKIIEPLEEFCKKNKPY